MMESQTKADLEQLAKDDIAVLEQKAAIYGPSWKQRGGVGAFGNISRKWDRIEYASKKYNWDMFAPAFIEDDSDLGFHLDESYLDDIADLRRYLALLECHLRECAIDGVML